MAKKVITRFPPSPTGLLHIGGAQTALFNYLFAKEMGGFFMLRFEDTDKERSKKEYEQDIRENLLWLGLIPDNLDNVWRQTERAEIHRKNLVKLIEGGYAYEAEKSSKSEGNVIRFKNPNAKITFTDLIRGEVTVDTTDLGDFVIARSITDPIYHLAVVVDDAEMGVTHIVRGEEHVSNTPRQILIIEALGFDKPQYTHFSLLRAADGSKLSKRHGAVGVSQYRDMGYLPETLINYLALAGWSSGDDRELFTLEELLKIFKLENIQKGGAVFDKEKLNWINEQYLKDVSDEAFAKGIVKHMPEDITTLPGYNEEKLVKIIPVLRERISVYSDVVTMADEGELHYFFETPHIDVAILVWKKGTKEDAVRHLEHVVSVLALQDNFTASVLKEVLWEYATEEGRGDVLWPMRYALSGREKSPDPFTLAQSIGKEESITRLNYASNLLKNS